MSSLSLANFSQALKNSLQPYGHDEQPSHDHLAPHLATAAAALLSHLFDSPNPFSMLRFGVSAVSRLQRTAARSWKTFDHVTLNLDTPKSIQSTTPRRVGWNNEPLTLYYPMSQHSPAALLTCLNWTGFGRMKRSNYLSVLRDI